MRAILHKDIISLNSFFNIVSNFAERRPYHLLGGLFILFLLQGYTSAFQNSVTVDEFAHLPAGLSYWKTGDFKIYHHSPPLIRLIASAPLLFTKTAFPEKFKNRWELGLKFMGENRDRYHALFMFGRTVIFLLSLILAYFLFRFANETLGVKSALFSVFLLSFSPNFLAHSYIVGTDVGVSLAILVALYALWKYLDNPSFKNLLICAGVFGVAQLTKFSALILIPAFPLLMTLDYLLRSLIKEEIKNRLLCI